MVRHGLERCSGSFRPYAISKGLMQFRVCTRCSEYARALQASRTLRAEALRRPPTHHRQRARFWHAWLLLLSDRDHPVTKL